MFIISPESHGVSYSEPIKWNIKQPTVAAWRSRWCAVCLTFSIQRSEPIRPLWYLINLDIHLQPRRNKGGHVVRTDCHRLPHLEWSLLTGTEGKVVHADVTDRQVHSANRRPRWGWESGSLRGLVPFYTTEISLPGLQITLFFKQFSTTCLTPSYCFSAFFSHSDLADYIRKLNTIWKSDRRRHTNMHTSPYLCGRELYSTKGQE